MTSGFCFPTLHQLRTVIVPMVDEMLATCPEALRPEFWQSTWCGGTRMALSAWREADQPPSANRMRQRAD